LALIAGVLLWPAKQARAQDTLLVEWRDAVTGDVIVNALRNTVLNDTLRPASRVYKLKKGGYYWNTERMENSGFALRIVGEAPGPAADENPAVLQVSRRGDGSVDQRMITVQDDLTLKNLWITGADETGVQTAYQPIQVDGSGHVIVVDNCIIDRSNFALIAFQGGADNKVFYTNNKFRNLIGRPSTQQWEGRGISIWRDQDTVIVENNTFFNVEFTPFQMESGAIKYLRFNHNTMVNIGRGYAGNWWREAYFANNLWVNPYWHGEGQADITSSGRDPRQYQGGIFGIGALPSIYGPEQGRRVLFGKTAAWRDPNFTAWYGDSIRTQYFVGEVAKLDYLSVYPDNIKTVDTTWLSTPPDFPTYPDTLLPKMWANITDLRRTITPATEYFFELPKNLDGTECYVCVSWPLPENFSYTSPANLLTAGSDGLPLGDLNWFPAQKAQFEANKAAYVKTVTDLIPAPPTFVPIANLEAENATLASGATVNTFQGFGYYQMDGGGSFEWTFDLAAAGQYDLNVWTNLRGNSIRGQHTYINGVEIHDNVHGYGELIYDVASGPAQGMDPNAWIWVKYTQADLLAAEAGALTLPAGQNVIRMSSSWGYQHFAGVDLLQAGTTTVAKSLRAPDVTAFQIVTPRGEGAPWVPSFFKSVVMGTNGTVTWNINPTATGNYTVSIFYQNYSGPQTVNVMLDGATVIQSVALPGRADSTGLSKLVYPPAFPIAAGSHTIGVAGGGVNLDYIQLTQVTTSVSEGDGLPERFALEQNYPNPFNPATTINFALPKASNVKLAIYNVLGQKVATLVDGQLNAGAHVFKFNAGSLASGVYFYRLEAGGYTANKKMLLLK